MEFSTSLETEIHMANQPYIVIMAGGLGSRFWPMSRQKRPKQFLDVLDSGQSMLATTVERFLSITVPENILIGLLLQPFTTVYTLLISNCELKHVSAHKKK